MEKEIKIEVLYGEFANLFGELQSINYLKLCIPEARVINTALHDEPAFINGDVDLVYMGAMTEKQQELVIEALTPYKEQLIKQIEEGTIFLFTGNALEIMEAYIENEDGSKIPALGIFDTYAKRDMMHRYNSLLYGDFEDFNIVGFKSQFSHSYGDNSKCFFYNVTRGDGLHPGVQTEGLRKNNFFGTYTLGPFLIVNPLFTKYLMKLMGIAEPVLAYEDVIMKAYDQRLGELKKEKLRYS